ncbi:MAG TPA: malto-oligosyltrehalose trehalohydrolase, partial [Acidobacteriota bacterium]
HYYFTNKHKTPWGDAINLDGKYSSFVRNFFIENALHWIHEFHMDGLRLDATHAIVDDSEVHFLKELATKVKNTFNNRKVLLIPEDHRNLTTLIQSNDQGGFALDAVWSDDFHHQIQKLLTGESDGYYCDFRGEIQDLLTIIRKGWLFCGQHSEYFGGARGSNPAGIPLEKFVFFLQNHDQVGNRATGERLHHYIDGSAYRAVSVLLLCLPQTPLLFMGQEWAASSRFCYFTNHNQELGKEVTEGRKLEFMHFSSFADPNSAVIIPDPQQEETFLKSKLHWSEQRIYPHAGILRLYQKLLELRQSEPEFRSFTFKAYSSGENALLLQRISENSTLLVVIQLKGPGEVFLPADINKAKIILTTEDLEFVENNEPLQIQLSKNPSVRFVRPGAVLMRYNR